jgi:hypothetical protein
MMGDEAITYQKCFYCLHQTKKALRNIYEEEGFPPSRAYQAGAPLSAPIIIVMPQPYPET